MALQKIYYKGKGPISVNGKHSLGEHVIYLQQNYKQLEENMIREKNKAEHLELENKMLKDALDSFFRDMENGDTHSIFSSFINWLNGNKVKLQEVTTLQKVYSLFDYIEKLEKNINEQKILLDNKDEEIIVIKNQFKFVCSENTWLISMQPVSNQDLLKYQKQLAEKQRIVEEKTAEVRNLQKALDDKDRQLKEALMKVTAVKTVQENKGRRLYQALENIAETSKLQRGALESETRSFEIKLKNVSEAIEQHCKVHSIEEIIEKANNSNTEKILQTIHEIQEEVKRYEDQVGKFQGSRDDKSYLRIKEMLTRIIERLDNIDSQKKEEIVHERRRTVALVKQLYKKLENGVTI